MSTLGIICYQLERNIGKITNMHELSVTESILEIALRHCKQAGASRVTDIYLVIGQLASIVDDSVQFYWDMISQDTPAAGTCLHFRRIPVELECKVCGQRYSFTGDDFSCPSCTKLDFKILKGEEFYLEAIDVED